MSSITPHDDAHDGFRVTIDPKHQEPIPAEIVSDSRNLLPRRLSVAGIVGLILFFLISAYIQAVKNGHKPEPKPPVVTITTSPGVEPSPLLTPFPVPTVIVVMSPGPTVRVSSAPRPSSRPSSSPNPKPTPKPSPKPSPSCLLPSPVPCI